MKSNLWIKRILRCTAVIMLIAAVLTISVPASATPITTSVVEKQSLQTQIVPTGDDKWSTQFMLGADNIIRSMTFAANGDLFVG